MGLLRASLVLVVLPPLANLSFRLAAPHQQSCWRVQLQLQLLEQLLLLLVLKLLPQLAEDRMHCCFLWDPDDVMYCHAGKLCLDHVFGPEHVAYMVLHWH